VIAIKTMQNPEHVAHHEGEEKRWKIQFIVRFITRTFLRIASLRTSGLIKATDRRLLNCRWRLIH